MKHKQERLERTFLLQKQKLERLKANRKITKEGRRNREKLLKSCKIISVAELLSFMEREKSVGGKKRTKKYDR